MGGNCNPFGRENFRLPFALANTAGAVKKKEKQERKSNTEKPGSIPHLIQTTKKTQTPKKKQNRQALVAIPPPLPPPLQSPPIGWSTTRPALGSGNLLPVCVPAWLPVARVSWGSAGARLDAVRLGSRCLIDMDYAYCPSKCCGVTAWARPSGRFAG